ncbi:MAG: histidinol-phosphate transaminase [Thermovirgaceae bacterium]|nr:histidinol-phosphate transaminase [Thermovirgaceae bacterium]
MAWLKNIIRNGLSGIEKYKYGKPVSELQRELGLERVVRMCSNENPWPLPESVMNAITVSLEKVNCYPDPQSYRLRRLLAEKWGVSTGEVIIGAGTEGILHSLFHATIDPGDEVVCPIPAYPLYRVAAIAAAAKFVEVPAEEGTTWEIGRIIDSCTEMTKAVIISNPCNPTGQIMERDRMLSLAHELDSRQILLVVDEAYAEYVEDPNYLAGIELFRDIGRIVITRTFSKIYGLAALRVGYAIAPKTIVEAYDKLHPVFEVSRVGQYAAHAALLEGAFIREVRLKTIAERSRVLRRLTDMGVSAENTRTNFVLIKHKKSDELFERLLHEGVIVRKGSDLGLEGYLRVTVGLPEQNDMFLSSMKKVLTQVA